MWFLFLAQSWALWHVRNKLSIQAKLINQPADVIYKTIIFLQLWTLNAKAQDRDELERMVGELRLLHAANKKPSA